MIAFHGQADDVVPYAGGELTNFPQWAGRPVIPVEAWAAEWARIDGCPPVPQAQPSIGDVEPLFWVGCTAPVRLYRVTDGGHNWPGGVNSADEGFATNAISATDLIWDFFAHDPMPLD